MNFLNFLGPRRVYVHFLAKHSCTVHELHLKKNHRHFMNIMYNSQLTLELHILQSFIDYLLHMNYTSLFFNYDC